MRPPDRRASASIRAAVVVASEKFPLPAATFAEILATSVPGADYPPDIRALRQQLSDMVKEDQDVRLAFDSGKMDFIDAKNRPELLRIFDQYGWVTNSRAGTDAAPNHVACVRPRRHHDSSHSASFGSGSCYCCG